MGSAAEDEGSNLYRLLGLSPDASNDEIRNAYYALAKAYHPDQPNEDENAEEVFKAITRAAAILRDPEKRRLYDTGIGDAIRSLQQPNSNRRRLILIFFVTLAVSSAVGSSLIMMIFMKMASPAVPNFAQNHRRLVIASGAADFKVPLHDFNQSYKQSTTPLPATSKPLPNVASEVPGQLLQLTAPSSEEEESEDNKPKPRLPTQDPISGSPEFENLVAPGQSQSKALPAQQLKSNKEHSLEASIIIRPTFDTSLDKNQALAAKLSSFREVKIKRDDCSLAQFARRFLVRVAAAFKDK